MAKERTFFQRLFGLNQEEKQMGSTNMLGYFGVNSTGKDYKYTDLAKEGYLQNPIVYKCVNEIAKGAAAVPYKIKAGDTPLENHPLMDLLDRPNPLESYYEFMSSLFGYLLLSGNAYVLKAGGSMGTPRELHLLRPDRITIKGSGTPIPSRYDYNVG